MRQINMLSTYLHSPTSSQIFSFLLCTDMKNQRIYRHFTCMWKINIHFIYIWGSYPFLSYFFSFPFVLRQFVGKKSFFIHTKRAFSIFFCIPFYPHSLHSYVLMDKCPCVTRMPWPMVIVMVSIFRQSVKAIRRWCM